MIARERYQNELFTLLRLFPAVGILGPRQVGKTTLAKYITGDIEKETRYLDLELQSDLHKLGDPELYLKENQDKCVIIDEIQVRGDLYPLLRALIDQKRIEGRFLILGSASPKLIKGASESLAGRIGYLQLAGFNMLEINQEGTLNNLWLRGGFPEVFLSANDHEAFIRLDNFIHSYVQTDLPQLGIAVSSQVIRRFWTMLAHFHGGIWNASNFGKALGVSNHTVNRYLDFMEGAFLVNRLPPFYLNTKKRLVKAPKIYIRDSGILHHLNEINSFDQLQSKVIVGNSWEGFVIEQIRQLKSRQIELYFFRTHDGAEVDLVFAKSLKPIATAEIKYTNSPKISKGFTESIKTLGTENNFVITPGSDHYKLKENITICSLYYFLSECLDMIL